MAPSRGITLRAGLCLRNLYPRPPIHANASRIFSTTAPVPSGHNRWSKIKHDKGKADAVKNRQRSIFSHEIATASKLFGADPNANPRLADLITKAKREGFAKASIEAAIARGQGRSASGASLEAVTVEGILPPNVAVIVECETDSKLRTLAEVRLAIRTAGGSVTPGSYLFTKKGKLTFEAKEGVGVDEMLEPALDAGALDVVEADEGRVVVFTEPGEISAVGTAIADALSVQIATSEIYWDPNEDTLVELPEEKYADELANFVDVLQERESSVQAIAMNAAQGSVGDDTWNELQSRIGRDV